MPEAMLADRCALMAMPGRPPPPKVRPADCPEGAAYIRIVDKGGSTAVLHPHAPFPIVIEGGDGDDRLVVVGRPSAPVLFEGGPGKDATVMVSAPIWFAEQIGPGGLVLLGALGLVLATVAAIAWRALRDVRR